MTATMLLPHAHASGRESVTSYGRRLSDLAAAHPHRPAIILVSPDGSEYPMSYRRLDEMSNRAAALLRDRGVRRGDWVVIGLPNGVDHYAFTFGAWKIGACVLPISHRLPERERGEMLALARPAVVIAEYAHDSIPTVCPKELADFEATTDALPDVVACPGKAIGSGGSTGRPKIIVDPDPWANAPGDVFAGLALGTGMAPNQVQLVAGPLYHNAPFSWGHFGLFEGHTLVVMQRFDADLALELVTRHGINFALLVPTMLRRMLASPALPETDFSSIAGIVHSAAPCPPWVKRAWLDLLGPDRLHEAYGSTESSGYTFLTGREWLAHPGSVGRPMATDIRIIDDAGNECPRGEVGEIYMRMQGRTTPTYRYIGSAPAATLPGGYVSVGDLGWLDEAGFL
ncbi:MAG TPA: AMP-binding protein, partial [Mycobacteriales bacterium]|nr:AMP-binding protein [Mycobacteriales bacterium]